MDTLGESYFFGHHFGIIPHCTADCGMCELLINLIYKQQLGEIGYGSIFLHKRLWRIRFTKNVPSSRNFSAGRIGVGEGYSFAFFLCSCCWRSIVRGGYRSHTYTRSRRWRSRDQYWESTLRTFLSPESRPPSSCLDQWSCTNGQSPAATKRIYREFTQLQHAGWG